MKLAVGLGLLVFGWLCVAGAMHGLDDESVRAICVGGAILSIAGWLMGEWFGEASYHVFGEYQR